MKTFSRYNHLPLSLAVALSLPFAAASTALADVHLSALFSDGAVLQRGIKAPVWGTADAGEAISVSVNGKQAKTTADAAGHWSLKLPVLEAGGPFDLTVTGKNTVVVHDVAVGEVWIASGQSNMEFPLNTYHPNHPVYGPKAKEEVAAINDPLLRMFTVIKKVSPQVCIENTAGPEGAWKAATPADAGKFSAVGYHYAAELRRTLKVPVGIIHTSWGGTPAEAWTSRAVLEADPKLKGITERTDKVVADAPAALKKYQEETLPAWTLAAEKAKTEGQPEPKKPNAPVGVNSPNLASTLFNAMLNPVIPYGIKGAIWYQGESNAWDGAKYRILFPAMIKDWRSHWNQGDFPFLFVQLANYQALQTRPAEGGWSALREAQTMTLSLPNTGMASAIDLADAENPMDIHPHNKAEVGRRLALIAFAKVYAQKITSYSGPLYSGVKITGTQARLSFTHADGGLVAKGDKLQGFAIAGKDGGYLWADAKIEGDAIVVSNAAVAEPVSVRYSWASNPIGNLYNKEGLPASPFRTDPDAAK